MAAALRNNKGQALIESVLVTPILILFFIYLVQALLYLTVEIAIDDALENLILCEVQNKTQCTSQFYQNTSLLPLKDSMLQFRKNEPIYEVSLKTTVLHLFKIEKKRQLNYVTQI